MKYTINLLPEKEQNLYDKIIYFSLNYLRYIIVITQLIVIIVFFYRFQIDQLIIDLKDEIQQKKEIIRIARPLFEEATIINQKINESERLLNSQNNLNKMFSYFISVMPETVYLNKLEINDKDIKVEGLAYNIGHLQAFYNLLRKENQFKIVDLNNIKKEVDGYSFVLNLMQFNQQ